MMRGLFLLPGNGNYFGTVGGSKVPESGVKNTTVSTIIYKLILIKYPRRALGKGSDAAGARSAGKAEAACRRLMIIVWRGQARESG